MRKPCRPESRRAPTITIWGVFVRLARANSPDTSFMVHHSPLQCQKITVLNDLFSMMCDAWLSARSNLRKRMYKTIAEVASGAYRFQVVQNGDYSTLETEIEAFFGLQMVYWAQPAVMTQQ